MTSARERGGAAGLTDPQGPCESIQTLSMWPKLVDRAVTSENTQVKALDDDTHTHTHLSVLKLTQDSKLTEHTAANSLYCILLLALMLLESVNLKQFTRTHTQGNTFGHVQLEEMTSLYMRQHFHRVPESWKLRIRHRLTYTTHTYNKLTRIT